MRTKIFRAAIVGAVVAVLAAGCGSSSSDGGSVSGSGKAGLAAAQAALDASYAGTDGPVPSSGPKAATDKTVWVITCGQAAEGCATPGNATAAAAKAIGWDSTVCDGKLNPASFGDCVRSATAAKADAVVLVSVDCAAIQEPLKAAQKAGIKVYSVSSFDCDENGGKAIFDGQIMFHGFDSLSDLFGNGFGPSIANYLIVAKEGAPTTLLVRQQDNSAAKNIIGGVEKALKTCAACKTYTVDISGQDFVDGTVASKVSAALVQHPDVNAVSAPYDAAIGLGVGQAVAKTERPILITGAEGLASAIVRIREGKQAVVAGSPAGRIGWAAIDGLNRIFAGEQEVDSGIGIQTVDKDHNLPAPGEPYDGNVGADGKPKQDYMSIYLQSWGR